MLRDDFAALRDPGSDEASIFRARILGWTKAWHEKDDADVAGRARIPTELKLLGVLRILGRSTWFDGRFLCASALKI